MLASLIVFAFAGTVLMYPAFHSDLAAFAAEESTAGDPTPDDRSKILHQVAANISVIIPARNEEKTLPALLDSLEAQTTEPKEILVVDDQSEDRTATIAARPTTRVISAGTRPEGWLGKPWALRTGAMASSGSLLLFLDADVQLRPNAIETLGRALLSLSPEWPQAAATISVQPYHRTVRLSERLALLFNILVFVGSARPDRGLRFTMEGSCCFGPCILCSRKEYLAIGGHEAVRDSVLDDMELGSRFRYSGAQVRSFIGRGIVEFRMYADGVRALIDGFTKNVLLGARRSCRLFRVLSVLWFTGMLAVLPYIGMTAALGMVSELVVASVFYTFFVIQIAAAGERLGNFGGLPAFFFPIHLAVFLMVLIRALLLAIGGRNVRWKGRRLDPAKRE